MSLEDHSFGLSNMQGFYVLLMLESGKMRGYLMKQGQILTLREPGPVLALHTSIPATFTEFQKM